MLEPVRIERSAAQHDEIVHALERGDHAGAHHEPRVGDRVPSLTIVAWSRLERQLCPTARTWTAGGRKTAVAGCRRYQATLAGWRRPTSHLAVSSPPAPAERGGVCCSVGELSRAAFLAYVRSRALSAARAHLEPDVCRAFVHAPPGGQPVHDQQSAARRRSGSGLAHRVLEAAPASMTSPHTSPASTCSRSRIAPSPCTTALVTSSLTTR